MKRPIDAMFALITAFLVAAALLASGGPAEAKSFVSTKCPWPHQAGDPAVTEDTELVLTKSSSATGECTVPAGTWTVGNVHILDGGTLKFSDAKIDFWTTGILVEKGGSLTAGNETTAITGPVTIHLYGDDQTGTVKTTQGKGILCRGDHIRCGVPQEIWESNALAKDCGAHCTPGNPSSAQKISQVVKDKGVAYDGPVTDDYFYPYHALTFDGAMHGSHPPAMGYFGYKVLGVSYGGTLTLFGKKGACTANCDKPETTGQSWVRLAKTIGPTDTSKTLIVSSPVDWKKGDEIVVTTTDYLPGHSEPLTVAADTNNGTTVKVNEQVTYHHNGAVYPIPADAKSKAGLSFDSVETRAAVALLRRSIRIVSEGKKSSCDSVTLETCFPPDSYFGGHVVIRQGFKLVQIQGVEFKQLGQGGRLGHYPIHFHHARKTKNKTTDPDTTYVKDSSINESMTRWIVLHGTQNVTLQRNVGWKSIGHGFYLEDGTETDNKLYANLGIFARAAVENAQNPRKVPGILAAPDLDNDVNSEHFPYKSDYDHPTVFWIMNGWNDFQYNMAAGAGTCGACYWLVGGYNSTISRTVDPNDGKGPRGPRWESYASMQSNAGRAAMTPLQNFVGNFCTSAMTSFQTITITEPCLGVGPKPIDDLFPFIPHVPNPLAEKANVLGKNAVPNLNDYPSTQDGGRFPTKCDTADCSTSPARCSATNNANCMVTVLDRYTTSFNYAPFNFAAIWLRPQWYLVTDSAITDVQQAGLTMVTGGGYSASDVITGHWALVRKSAFIGHTQPATNQVVLDAQHPELTTGFYPDNPFAADGGPFNPVSKLRCAMNADKVRPGNRCVSVDDGVAFQMSNFGMYQRLFSVYDGPAFQDSNAYLDITRRDLDDCKPFEDVKNGSGRCDPDFKDGQQSKWLAGFVQGLPKREKAAKDKDNKDVTVNSCYMPNAAIGWKQPNGFYYPPAFHSEKLFFKDVDIRHFVVSPLFEEGTLTPNKGLINTNYCWWAVAPTSNLFTGFAGNDRQTVLNDDDGSLTGYTAPGNKPTTVINLDDFFLAPVEAIQCRSADSSRTSPYDYVTTVLYPKCVIDKKCAAAPVDDATPNFNDGDWNRACTNEQCFGIPLWRQDQMPKSDKTAARSIRMMGQQTGQRSSLTVNHGTYYFDTAVSKETQQACVTSDPAKNPCVYNEFKSNDTYYVFLIFAKADTEQTYRFYVGPNTKDLDDDPTKYMTIQMAQASIGPNPVDFKNFQAFPEQSDKNKRRVRWFDKTKGIVEINLKVTDVIPDLATSIKAAKKNKCQPATYCTWNAGKATDPGRCEDNNSTTTPKSDAVCRWAVADLDCPDGGCVGFVFTLPGKFKTLASTDSLRPPAACLTKAAPWDVSFEIKSDLTCPRDALLPAGDRLAPDFCP